MPCIYACSDFLRLKTFTRFSHQADDDADDASDGTPPRPGDEYGFAEQRGGKRCEDIRLKQKYDCQTGNQRRYHAPVVATPGKERNYEYTQHPSI